MRRIEFLDGFLDELDALAREQSRIEPWLARAAFPPMTCLLIPSILEAADRLLSRLGSYRGPREAEAKAMYVRLWELRQHFGPLNAGDAMPAVH